MTFQPHDEVKDISTATIEEAQAEPIDILGNSNSTMKYSSFRIRAICLFVYMILWSACDLSVHSTSKEKIKIPSPLLVVLVEFIKFWVALVCFFALSETIGKGCQELKDYMFLAPANYILPLLKAYAPVAILYAADNNLSIVNLRFFDPTTFLLLSSARLLLTGAVWHRVFHEEISHLKWKALNLVAVGVLIKGIPDMVHSNQPTSSLNAPSLSSYIVHLVLLALQLCSAVAASVYNEKILKTGVNEDIEQPFDVTNPHVHNMCLYVIGFVLNLGILGYHLATTTAVDDNSSHSIHLEVQESLFQLVHSPRTQISIVLLAAAGVSTSMLLRYMDSVAKAVAGSCEPAIVAVISYVLFGYPITVLTAISMVLIGWGAYLYARSNEDGGDAQTEHSSLAPTFFSSGRLLALPIAAILVSTWFLLFYSEDILGYLYD